MQIAQELTIELERQHEAAHLQATCQGDLTWKSGRNRGWGGGAWSWGSPGLEGAAGSQEVGHPCCLVPGSRTSMLPASQIHMGTRPVGRPGSRQGAWSWWSPKDPPTQLLGPPLWGWRGSQGPTCHPSWGQAVTTGEGGALTWFQFFSKRRKCNGRMERKKQKWQETTETGVGRGEVSGRKEERKVRGDTGRLQSHRRKEGQRLWGGGSGGQQAVQRRGWGQGSPETLYLTQTSLEPLWRIHEIQFFLIYACQ